MLQVDISRIYMRMGTELYDIRDGGTYFCQDTNTEVSVIICS